MPIKPDLKRERALWAAGSARVAGVDEVGLGSLCGPVVAAAVCLPPGCRRLPGVRDSKTLSPGQRERLYPAILRQATAVGVGAASMGEIQRLNVLRATHRAMARALRRAAPVDHALIDGRPFTHPELGAFTTIIDGDALCYSIACASIIAKVLRDRYMQRLSARYPGYGWEVNAGYGTRQHRDALQRLGLTPFHRLSYGPVQQVLLVASGAPSKASGGEIGADREGLRLA